MEEGRVLAALLAAVAGGERDALRRLYVAQSARLFGIANAMLRDAFLAIHRQAGQFDPAQGRRRPGWRESSGKL
ncbi:hypothetical protein JYK14_27355 [Siccirubricoccus sp. KC 17139]|uniref:RNA polymerase sigma-70 region 2 domain-containing protein n=1 Tax=Siccirubricoccus soli TaxID=2899147 RepID=A0ABT1DD39_9PROT|nr:hypothetical protein [Siccirubricoccus soli]MCO6419851.1 hypothetical protein [Siccirubricoccus soli]MCP2685986.1 hypothetical protein [Siccirubricoccus soli]